MGKFTALNHPLIQRKLTIIRKKDIGTNEFRQVAGEIGDLMVYEMTRDLSLKNVEIETPIGKTAQKELVDKKLVIISISRVGLGMVDGVLQVTPSAKVGHIGIYHDEETLKPHEHFFKMSQDIEERDAIIVGPMPATGGSVNMAIDTLKKHGAKSIHLAVLVAVSEGVKNIQEAHPDADIHAAAGDEKLTDNGHIFPGLGDAGDRLSGTKQTNRLNMYNIFLS